MPHGRPRYKEKTRTRKYNREAVNIWRVDAAAHTPPVITVKI